MNITNIRAIVVSRNIDTPLVTLGLSRILGRSQRINQGHYTTKISHILLGADISHQGAIGFPFLYVLSNSNVLR